MSRFWTRRDNQGTSQYVPLPLDFIAGKIQQEQQGLDVSRDAVTNAILKSGYINAQTGDYRNLDQTQLYLQKQKEVQQKKEALIDELNKDPYAWKDVYNKTNRMKQEYYTDPDIIRMEDASKHYDALLKERNKLGKDYRNYRDPYTEMKGVTTNEKGVITNANSFEFTGLKGYSDRHIEGSKIMEGFKASGEKTGYSFVNPITGMIEHHTGGSEQISPQQIAQFVGIKPYIDVDEKTGKSIMKFNVDGTMNETVNNFLTSNGGQDFIDEMAFNYKKAGKELTNDDIIKKAKLFLYEIGSKQIFNKSENDFTMKNDAVHAGKEIEKFKRSLNAEVPIYAPVDNTLKTPEDYNKKKVDLQKSKTGLVSIENTLNTNYNDIGTEMGVQNDKDIIPNGVNIYLGKDKISTTKKLVQQANQAINPDSNTIDLEKLAKINSNHPILKYKNDKDKITNITQGILLVNGQQQEYNNVRNKVVEVENHINAIDNEINKQYNLENEYNKLEDKDKKLFKTKDDFINYIKTNDIKYADLSNQEQRIGNYTTSEDYLRQFDKIKNKYSEVKNEILKFNPSLGIEGMTYEPGKNSTQDKYLDQINRLFKGNKDAVGKLKVLNSSENINDKIANGEIKDLDASNIKLVPHTDNNTGKTSFIMYYNNLKPDKDGNLIPTKESKSIKIEADESTVKAWRDGILQGETENNVKHQNGSMSSTRHNQVKNQLGIGFAETMFKDPEVINEGTLTNLKIGDAVTQQADNIYIPNTEFTVIGGKGTGKDRLYTIKITNTSTGEVLEKQAKISAIKQIIGRVGIRASEHLNSSNLEVNQGLTLQNKIKEEFNKTDKNE